MISFAFTLPFIYFSLLFSSLPSCSSFSFLKCFLPIYPQVAICLLGFVNLMGVGSVNDWSTVYFSTILHTTPFYTSMGYAFFITFQILGQVCSLFILLISPLPLVSYIFLQAYFTFFFFFLFPFPHRSLLIG